MGLWRGQFLALTDGSVPGATSFPSVILNAATFNEFLWKLLVLHAIFIFKTMDLI